MEWYGNGPPTLSGFLDLCQDIDKIEDPVKKQSTIAFIHNFGQMPRQVCTCVCVVCVLAHGCVARQWFMIMFLCDVPYK